MARRFWVVIVAIVAAAVAFWLLRLERPPVNAGVTPKAGTASDPQAPPTARTSALTESIPSAAPPAEVPLPSEVAPPQAISSSVTPGAVMQTTTPAAVAVRKPDPPRGPPMAEDPAKAEAEAVALNIRHFSQRFGGNPEGTNAEIVKALTGANPKGATYLPADVLRLNGEGELIDRWGSPYFFHQISADHMEVRSAGPDTVLWTPDDLVTR